MWLRISIFYFPLINHSPPAGKQLPGGVSRFLSSTRTINILWLGDSVAMQTYYPLPRQHREKAFLPSGNSRSTGQAIPLHSSSPPSEPRTLNITWQEQGCTCRDACASTGGNQGSLSSALSTFPPLFTVLSHQNTFLSLASGQNQGINWSTDWYHLKSLSFTQKHLLKNNNVPGTQRGARNTNTHKTYLCTCPPIFMAIAVTSHFLTTCVYQSLSRTFYIWHLQFLYHVIR